MARGARLEALFVRAEFLALRLFLVLLHGLCALSRADACVRLPRLSATQPSSRCLGAATEALGLGSHRGAVVSSPRARHEARRGGSRWRKKQPARAHADGALQAQRALSRLRDARAFGRRLRTA